MSIPRRTVSFEKSDGDRTTIVRESILAVFIFSMITATSLSINSLMQLVFETYIKTPQNKILGNIIWVCFNFGLIIALLLTVYKNTVIKV